MILYQKTSVNFKSDVSYKGGATKECRLDVEKLILL